jgi:hypothetical protein
MNLVRMYLICNVFSFRLLSFNVSLTVEGIVALKRLVLQSDKAYRTRRLCSYVQFALCMSYIFLNA